MGLFKKKKSLHDIEFMKKYVLGNEAPFRVVESYKTIRTNLQYVLSPLDGNVIAVSSSNQGERKSTFAANIAIAFAQSSSRVLLIDADMRKPVMHRLFELDNTNGLSSCLAGFASISEAIAHDVRENLDVLSSGPTPPNPSELLAGKNMDLLLAALSDAYDYIIIDTPPINIVTDAVVLSKKATGIVLVAQYSNTGSKAFQYTVDSVKRVSANVLGVVIAGTPKKSGIYGKYMRKNGYHYNYYDYYERDDG